MRYLQVMALLTAFALAGCAAVHRRSEPLASPAHLGPPVELYVVRRGWHTDIGFNAIDIPLPLSAVRAKLPAARYVLFGFGDRHYLMNNGRRSASLLGAIWPGPAVVLVTGLTMTPEQAFGADGVIRLTLNAGQAQRLQEFVWDTLASSDGVLTALAAGPYEGSYYYASRLRYSGLNTCNTWTAKSLQGAGLPVHSFAVEFSGQVWRQVRSIEQPQSRAR